jgi:uncharacterized membrane protein
MNDVRMQHSRGTFSIFAILAMFMLGLLLVQGLGFVFIQLGIPPWLVLIIVPGSLLGSLVNIPVTTIQSDPEACQYEYVSVWRLQYKVSLEDCPGETKISVNLGGAVIPVIVSGYLLLVNPIDILPSLLAIVIVAVFVKSIARVEPEVGIITPALLPPLIAALTAMGLMLFFPGVVDGYVIAYVSGTLGTLIGADLLNIPRLGELRTSQASIGGAGTWDGVFLTGILAVFLL